MSLKKILHWIKYKEIGSWRTLLLITGILLTVLIIISRTGDGLDAIFDRTPNTVIIVKEPTKVYKTIASNEVIVILNKGDKAKSLYQRTPKSGLYYKVKLKDGREGYIGYSSSLIIEKK